MGVLDPTIDAQVMAVVQREFPEFDPTKVQWVSEIPTPPADSQLIKIVSVRDLIIGAFKSGAKIGAVWVALTSAWDGFVAGVTLLKANNLPSARELTDLVRTEATNEYDDFSDSIRRERENTYFVIDDRWVGQLPSDLELKSYQPNPFGNDRLILINALPVSGSTMQTSVPLVFTGVAHLTTGAAQFSGTATFTPPPSIG